MNFNQLAGRVKRESGRSGPSPAGVLSATADDARIYAWVADAWRDLQNEPVPWRFMRRTCVSPLVIGKQDYSNLDLNIAEPRDWVPQGNDYRATLYEPANPASEWPLSFVPYEFFRRNYMTGQLAPGVPMYWTIGPLGKLYFAPTPDRAVTLRADYFRGPTELVNDADTPDLPARYHMILVWMAMMQLSGMDAAPEVFARAAGNFATVRNALWMDQGPSITTTMG